MVVNFKYKDSPEFKIDSISVIGEFNNFNEEKNMMQLSDGYWQTDIDFVHGKHLYKFFVNGIIKLNDPLSNMYLADDKGELWSAVIINEQNQRLYDDNQYTVNIESYAVANMITDSDIAVNKKNFNKTYDKQAVLRFGFNKITGLHAVTAVWYDPYGRVYEISENSLFADQGSPNRTVFLWFWISLKNQQKECLEGTYTIKLFIDGNYTLEDEIMIIRAITYSSKGYFNMYT